MIEFDKELTREIVMRGKRISNREFDQYRDIVIEPNVIPYAEGSCKVKVGDTEIIAGIKMDIGKPYPDSPDEGVITVNAELVPLASPDFESGPPRQESIELARVVDRAIRESKMIDLGKLCIKEKEHIWMIFVDIDVINDDGNLIDAACLAAVGALLNTRIPKLEMDGETPVVNRDEKSANKLPLTGIAITTTFVKIAGQLMADPNLAEFKALDARLSIGTLKGKLCSMQKGGTYGFGIDEIDKMVDLAEKKGDELRTLLEKHIL